MRQPQEVKYDACLQEVGKRFEYDSLPRKSYCSLMCTKPPCFGKCIENVFAPSIVNLGGRFLFSVKFR